MKKVVFDTNVLLSASLIKGSVSFLAFKKGVENCHILRSDDLAKEFIKIIRRKKFDKYFPSVNSRYELILSFLAASQNVKINHSINVCRDPKDNMLLELALSGKAETVITGDKDLLVLNPFRAISIISPDVFVKA